MKIDQAKNLRLEESINRDAEIQRAGRTPILPVRLLWIVAAIALLTAGIWWWSDRSPQPTMTSTPPTEAALAPGEAAPLPPNGEFTAAGYLEPIPPYPVKITPLVAGRIDHFTVLEGDEVSAGQVIAKLNTERHQRQAEELNAALAINARRLELATREQIRSQTLSDKGAATAREFDLARAEVDILSAEAEKIRAELNTVLWQIEQSDVRSPVDGILFERLGQAGEYINLEERHEIASVHDPRQLQVWVDVNQRDAARIQVGQPVKITLDAEPGREFSGSVSRILPRASMTKNTIRCIITLEETSPSLRPDMSVKATFSKP